MTDLNLDVIYNDSTDPFFNLAAEQYLLDCREMRPVFMLWRNAGTVVIGRNQNAYAEINESFVRENDIKVVRRLTGGGAVFHDEGNVNYSFISPREGTKSLDFERFCAPVIEALRSLGANAGLSGRNDIEIDGFKVSGNAQCVRKDKILHHGTLLWSADLGKLAGSLRVDPEKIAAKGIKSVRSRVANIRDILHSGMDAAAFIEYIFSRIGREPRCFTEGESAAINELRNSRYSTWEWNWGESKKFSARRKKRFSYGTVEISFDSNGGLIEAAAINGDFFGVHDVSQLAQCLAGTRLEHEALTSALKDVSEFISGSSAEDIVSLILASD